MLQVKERIEKLAQDVASTRMQAEFGRLGKDRTDTEARQKGVATLQEVLGNFEKQLRRLGERADLRQHKATQSSDDAFSVTLEKGAQQLDFDVRVEQLATVHQIQVREASALAGAALTFGDPPRTVALDIAGLDLTRSEGVKALATRLNEHPALKDAVRADLRHAPGSSTPHLLLTATKSGAAAAFTLACAAATQGGALPGVDVLAQGQDAVVVLGNRSESYASNEIALFTGVKLSLKKTQAPNDTTRVSIAPDMDGTAANMRALVQAYDTLRKQLRELMDPGAPGGLAPLEGDEKRTDVTPAGPFYADAGVRALLRDLERHFERPVTIAGKTFDPSAFGVKRSADGSVSFDQKRFEAAYAQDKELLAAWFGESADVMKRDTAADLDRQGAGMRLAVRIREWTDEVTGVLKHRTDSDEIVSRRLAEQQERLSARFRTLVARYTSEFARAEQVRQQMEETRSFVDALFGSGRKSDR
ncbi:flagellar filament capping protein FliD [Pandoraea nosoerga]|uniref:Flagellar hook-associated protein 2 n=1 Tax=Pandoraea nosoerga TaxID=2508296 RepID=A0A5E4WBY2_9BURK|nr:flagellar filament capping protein FliD [Pandoraea nosoerga]MBN4667379.1 flagellar filament capping protein FliD [Pandoraea nosoerga]MBN4677305.1 flagellar filament capping protein FliD [Pandoraea nosoerga]MBN4682426.1 flagellar filament capping protein FliD [Pandoraea nosoerga]VVE22517.1 flagellar capping protein [Pandoraea nosoerga]